MTKLTAIRQKIAGNQFFLSRIPSDLLLYSQRLRLKDLLSRIGRYLQSGKKHFFRPHFGQFSSLKIQSFFQSVLAFFLIDSGFNLSRYLFSVCAIFSFFRYFCIQSIVFFLFPVKFTVGNVLTVTPDCNRFLSQKRPVHNHDRIETFQSLHPRSQASIEVRKASMSMK